MLTLSPIPGSIYSNMLTPRWTLPRDKSPGVGDKHLPRSWLLFSVPTETSQRGPRLPSPDAASPVSSGHSTKRAPASPSQRDPAGAWPAAPSLTRRPPPPQGSMSTLGYSDHILFKYYDAIFLLRFPFVFVLFYSSLLILTVSSNCLPCGMKISQAYVNSLSLWNSGCLWSLPRPPFSRHSLLDCSVQQGTDCLRCMSLRLFLLST